MYNTSHHLGRSESRKEAWELMHFIAQKSKEARKPLSLIMLCEDFIQESGTSQTAEEVEHQVVRLCRKIPKLTCFDTETKVLMLFSLSVPIDEEYMNELQNDAIVEVDEMQRITMYKLNDGSFELEGDHSWSTKVKAICEEEIRRSGISRDAETSEENSTSNKEYKAKKETDDGNIPFQHRVKPKKIQEVVILDSDEEEEPKEKKPRAFSCFNNLNGSKLEDVESRDDSEEARCSSPLSNPSSMTSSQPSTGSISAMRFLKMIRNLARALETPMLLELQEKIKRKMRGLGENDIKVPIKSVLQALESAVNLVNNHVSMGIPNADSTSFKEFLLILRTATFNLSSPELADFQKDLKKSSNQIGNQDKRVSFEKIQFGLDYAIAYVLP